MRLHKFSTQTRQRTQYAGESGQALVETAVTMALLIILLIGAAEIGRVAYAAIEVTNAAKAAVQYGDQNPGTAGDITGMQTAASLAAPNLPNLNTVVQNPPSCVCANGQPSTCSVGDCTGSQVIETIHVTTSATFDPLIHLPGLPTTYTLYGQAYQQRLSN